jgi:hypothetical protein
MKGREFITLLGGAASGGARAAAARDRLEEALARIADPKGEGARACLTVYSQAARSAAEAADARARAGMTLGPLDGAIIALRTCSMSPESRRARGQRCLLMHRQCVRAALAFSTLTLLLCAVPPLFSVGRAAYVAVVAVVAGCPHAKAFTSLAEESQRDPGIVMGWSLPYPLRDQSTMLALPQRVDECTCQSCS